MFSVRISQPVKEAFLIPKGHILVILPAKKIERRKPPRMAHSALQDLILYVLEKLVCEEICGLQRFQFLSVEFHRAYSI